MKLEYAVVFEQSLNNYCAYAPDVPGCISTGDDWEHMQEMIKEAIAFHIEGMLEHGEPLPQPTMSIEDAIAYHNQPYDEDEKQALLEVGYTEADLAGDPNYPTRYGMVEVEISLPQSVEAV